MQNSHLEHLGLHFFFFRCSEEQMSRITERTRKITFCVCKYLPHFRNINNDIYFYRNTTHWTSRCAAGRCSRPGDCATGTRAPRTTAGTDSRYRAGYPALQIGKRRQRKASQHCLSCYVCGLCAISWVVEGGLTPGVFLSPVPPLPGGLLQISRFLQPPPPPRCLPTTAQWAKQGI